MDSYNANQAVSKQLQFSVHFCHCECYSPRGVWGTNAPALSKNTPTSGKRSALLDWDSAQALRWIPLALMYNSLFCCWAAVISLCVKTVLWHQFDLPNSHYWLKWNYFQINTEADVGRWMLCASEIASYLSFAFHILSAAWTVPSERAFDFWGKHFPTPNCFYFISFFFFKLDVNNLLVNPKPKSFSHSPLQPSTQERTRCYGNSWASHHPACTTPPSPCKSPLQAHLG